MVHKKDQLEDKNKKSRKLRDFLLITMMKENKLLIFRIIVAAFKQV